MPPDFTPWTPTAKLEGVPPNPRALDCIQVAYWSWLKQVATQTVPKSPDLCVDISQGVERKSWSPTPRTLSKTSQVYVFPLDRVLDGEDGLQCFALSREQ